MIQVRNLDLHQERKNIEGVKKENKSLFFLFLMYLRHKSLFKIRTAKIYLVGWA
jgi:hypothetical protein